MEDLGDVAWSCTCGAAIILTRQLNTDSSNVLISVSHSMKPVYKRWFVAGTLIHSVEKEAANFATTINLFLDLALDANGTHRIKGWTG